MIRIFMLQKRIIRIINGASFLAHTDLLFYENKILKLFDIYKLNIGIYMFEARNSEQFVRNYPYNTRHRSELLSRRPHLTICENSIGVVGPHTWNSIPDEVKNSSSKASFKQKYKKLLLASYAS